MLLLSRYLFELPATSTFPTQTILEVEHRSLPFTHHFSIIYYHLLHALVFTHSGISIATPELSLQLKLNTLKLYTRDCLIVSILFTRSSRFRPGPTSPSSSSSASSSSQPPPPPPPSGGAPPPPPQSRSASQRGASAPPERVNPTSAAAVGVAEHRRTLHAGVPLTGPGLSGSADATGATTTIRVGGNSNSSAG